MDHTSTFLRPQLALAARTPQQQVHYTTASARERLARYWMGALKGSEFKVLTFIVERTLPFGKRSEVIPLRHFTDGVWTRDGNVVTSGTGLGRRTVILAISTLVRSGLVIRRDRTPKKNGYAQDSYWFEIDFNHFWSEGESMLRTPKKLRKEIERGECSERTGGVQKLHPKAIEEEAMEKPPFVTDVTKGVAGATTPRRMKQPKRPVAKPAPSYDTVAEAAHAALARQAEKRREKIKKAESKLTLVNFNKMWETVHVRHHPGTPCNAISVRDFSILRSSLKSTKIRGGLFSFIEWLFDSYPTLKISKRFSWINKNADYPPLPSILNPASMVRYFKHFVAAYDEQTPSGYNERPVDWKDKAAKLSDEREKMQEELRRTVEANRKLLAEMEAMKRDNRAMHRKLHKHSQVVEDTSAPLKMVEVDLGDDDLGDWKNNEK